MSNTVLKKEFNERDLQRVRNLVQKKVNDKTTTSVGYSEVKETHEEGDIWEENGKKWTIKNGIKQSIRKINHSGTPLLCPSCSKSMQHPLDKKMYAIHQKCLHCVTEMESLLKIEGKYEEYEKQMISNNANYFADTLMIGIDQILDDVINESYITEDGTIQNWIGQGINKDKISQEVTDKLKKLKDVVNNL
jgi:hypothetical protein